MAPGARIIKTGIAVAVTLYICSLLKLEPAIFGAISAVINLQPSMYLTFRTAWNQVLAHIVGVGVALVLGYSLGGSPFTMGMATVIIIWLYLKLKLENGILMGIVAAIFVMGASPDQFFNHALVRSGVIFTGLFVATMVNILLFRPQYQEKYIEKVRNYNREAAEFFISALEAYRNLQKEIPPDSLRRLTTLRGMYDECQTLATLYSQENMKFLPGGLKGEDHWYRLALRFMEYSRGLVDRGNEIFELLPVRYKRRSQLGEQPLSEEFQVIVAMLVRGASTIQRINDKLRLLVCDQAKVGDEPITEDYWDELSRAIDDWQFKFAGSYYLHSLLELSVVAANIRWAARQGKEILNLKQV